MSDLAKVAIFWDYENCSPPSSSCGLGYDIVNNIGRIGRVFGSVTTFKAYLDVSSQSSKSVALRSELQSSGVSMIDCPHNGKKDVVDKMILVDMLAFAVDHPVPATIILITGDRDYAYAVSTLRLRNYHVVLIVPSSPHTPPCLESQASLVVDWSAAILKPRTQSPSDLDAKLVAKLTRELEERSVDNSSPAQYTLLTPSIGTSKIRRTSTRDLLEPSTFSGCPENPVSSQPREHSVESSRISGASDPSLGGLSIPRTPSRSRHASVDAPILTRARSATVVSQSVNPRQAVEPVSPVGSLKHTPASTARRLSVPNIAGGSSVVKSSPPALPSLDALELPLLHDGDGPPSSIVVRSPLEKNQMVNNASSSTKLTSSLSSPLNHLASPFVMAKTSIGLKPSFGHCSDVPQDKATTSVVTPPKTKTLGSAASICGTSRTDNTEIPEAKTSLEVDSIISDDDGAPTRSLPEQAGAKEENAAKTPRPNYRSDAAPHTAHASSISEGELRTVVTFPDNEHVVPSAAITLSGDLPPGFGNDVNLTQPSPLSRAQATAPVCPPFDPLLPPSVESCQSNEINSRETWTKFQLLIHYLLVAREKGIVRPSRSIVASYLIQLDKQIYQRAGVSRFKDYTALAEKAGVIELGGKEADAWISLHPSWLRMEASVKSSQSLSNESSSLAAKPSEATSTSSKNPPIERTPTSQPPAPSSPGLGSVHTSISPSGSPTGQNLTSHAFVPAKFWPLIDILVRLRENGTHQTLRSFIGQLLGAEVYTRAGVPGFKEFIQLALSAQLVECGGSGGYAWIRLHPDLRV